VSRGDGTPRIVWAYLAVVVTIQAYLWSPLGFSFNHPISGLLSGVTVVLALFVARGKKNAWLASLVLHITVAARLAFFRLPTAPSVWLGLWISMEIACVAILSTPRVRTFVSGVPTRAARS
jgi:hypothetical protein